MNALPAVEPKARAKARPRTARARRDGFVALDACHKQMLRAAHRLEELVAMIDEGGITPLERAAAKAIAEFYSTTSRRHHEDEERHIFPPLLASGNAELVQAVQRLQQDHGWLEEDWLELEPHVRAIAHGYGQCDMDMLRQGVKVFALLHRDHIALEESLAYPEARVRISTGARREMGREMAARRRADRSSAGSS